MPMTQSNNLTISVLVTSFQRPKWLGECLDSLLVQTHKPVNSPPTNTIILPDKIL